MVTLHIDNAPYQVEDGQCLLSACLALGLNLTYFCWHPALGSVGACRQCAVIQYKDERDDQGRLVMACMTPVKDGLRVSLNAAPARDFRAGNIELLMTNHPHDCPVCEEGGECHLQDMTLMSGHTVRRYRGLKRTYRNQDMGPFINHEMNRCIACYRCVRFYDDYAGGKDLQALGIHNTVYFGRFEDGALDNEFSGNLVEVCPTGVFTDKTFSAHYVRKWDLQTAPSVCGHCSLGCNTSPGERYGELRRIVNRYNHDVNGYFLCDRGRFGYGFVNSSARLKYSGGDAPPEQALEQLRAAVADGRTVLGIGSPRASVEANFMLRTLVGADNFHAGLGAGEQDLLAMIYSIMRQGGIGIPSLKDAEAADAVLILGSDITQTGPRLALALRQAARSAVLRAAEKLKIPAWLDAPVRELAKDYKTPFVIASPRATQLDDCATDCFRAGPEAIARLGFAVAHALDAGAPVPNDTDPALAAKARTIADCLREARRPLIVTGVECASLDVIQAAYNIAKALPADRRSLAFALPEANSLGLTMLGGRPLAQARERVRRERAVVIILENDLYRRAAPAVIDGLLTDAERVVVIDGIATATSGRADMILPAATYAESDGTLVNNEGRAQRYFSVFPPAPTVRPSWQWLAALIPDRDFSHFDAVTRACAEAVPALAGIVRAAPERGFRVYDMKIPRQAERASGRTALHADVDVSESQQPPDPETPFAYSMEGALDDVPPALKPMFWSPGWNSNQAVNKFQDDIGGHLRGGESGIRLIESVDGMAWFQPPAAAAGTTPADLRRVVFLPHIFGSEELSALSPPIAERSPAPFVALNPADAGEMEPSELVRLYDENGRLLATLPLKLDASLARGLVGLPLGFAGIPALADIRAVKLLSAAAAEKRP